MEHSIEHLRDLRRQLNSIEHMIYVSCKFTRTSEMLRKVMETIVVGYEQFFSLAYMMFSEQEGGHEIGSVQHKVQLLTEVLSARGIHIDLSDYFLLKRLLISDFESIGEYRKNLCIVSYMDGQEYMINMPKLLEFYENLKLACGALHSLM